MKREVIQDFLNLPGIAGVALMDGRSRPYFCGIAQTLNFQQKETLAQGILQIVETIPDGFEAFEFQFANCQVHIYKLDRGMILLVLTHQGLVHADYSTMMQGLKVVLREDIPNAIATFRLFAGNITLSSSTDRKPNAHTATLTEAGTTNPLSATNPLNNGVVAAKPATATTTTQPTQPSAALQAPPPPPSTANLKDAIAALNHLSQFTTQYLGTHVVVNYWKLSRPQLDWLEHFQIDRSAQLSFTDLSPQVYLAPLTPQEQEWIQSWVAAFVKRCSQVLRDFPTIIQGKALNDQQKAILLG